MCEGGGGQTSEVLLVGGKNNPGAGAPGIILGRGSGDHFVTATPFTFFLQEAGKRH